MNENKSSKIILAIIVIILIGGAGYFTFKNRAQEPETIQKQETNEEKLEKDSSETNTNKSARTTQPNKDGISTGWKLVDVNSFTVLLPTYWKFNKLQSINSDSGEFLGSITKLTYDYGLYSNQLPGISDPDHKVTFETIDGHNAKIVVPKTIGKGITGVYFDNVGGQRLRVRLQISGENLSSAGQQTSLEIFRSIKFK